MARQQVFYIHGGSAYSKYEDFLQELKTKTLRDLPGQEVLKKWPSTLREDLGEGYEVFMPSMPNSQNAKYQEWKIWFERHFEYFKDDIVLVGWSQGAYFLVKYLLDNELPVKIKALILLAAPFDMAELEGEDGGDFRFDINRVGDLELVTANIFILHSTDDPIVPFQAAENYKMALSKARLVTFTDKNHFLVESLPELLDLITEVT